MKVDYQMNRDPSKLQIAAASSKFELSHCSLLTISLAFRFMRTSKLTVFAGYQWNWTGLLPRQGIVACDEIVRLISLHLQFGRHYLHGRNVHSRVIYS